MMIDDMIATLKIEQADDDAKKEYCAKELDAADDKKKGLERAYSDLETAIENAQEDIAKLSEEIDVLKASIKELDKNVLEATEQRKEENEDYKDLMASDTAAKELIKFAKNRLNKSEDSMGVIAMIDLLIADLDKEMTVAETDEKD